MTDTAVKIDIQEQWTTASTLTRFNRTMLLRLTPKAT